MLAPLIDELIMPWSFILAVAISGTAFSLFPVILMVIYRDGKWSRRAYIYLAILLLGMYGFAVLFNLAWAYSHPNDNW